MGGAQQASPSDLPRLVRAHGATQLVVDGRPTLLRAGELENSSASNADFMTAIWPKLAAMHFADARQHGMRLVLLWFGSWKNSMSSYVPAWVKRDVARFPRAVQSDGKPLEILSAFSASNLNADARAFTALMSHLKATDADRHTVVMVQVENEIGMIPEARGHSAAANRAFDAPVPSELTHYLMKHKGSLAPELASAWQENGFKTGASWTETFGSGVKTDELFTAWTEGTFTGAVTARGKSAYSLPMFVNAALIRPGKVPGQYPSGGPLPHLFDIWKAAAPAVDFLSSEAKAIEEAYDVLDQLTPLILEHQGTTRIVGIKTPTSFDGVQDLAAQAFTFGQYTFDVRFKQPPPISTGAKEETELPGAHGGLILQVGPDEFIVAGTGMIMTFGSNDGSNPVAGIETVEEGRFARSEWKRGRVLNGDDTNQGRQLSLPSGRFVVRRIRLYRYH
jgi:beta-galactosidase GanA